MKPGITKFVIVAAIAVLVVVAGSTAAWASCPTSPNYLPDFSSNQNCMTLNGNASFPANSAAAITSWSGASGIVTFQAANGFASGQLITLSGFTTSTYFNGLAFFVLDSGLTSSQFQIAFSGFTGTGLTEAGLAAPKSVLQLTPAAQTQAGSGWYNTPQPVVSAFSTTFSFQLGGGNTSLSPADGIAFLIQNSPSSPAPGALNALGPNGCGIGFGDSSSGCTPATGGITNSLAVEFNTFFNSGIDPNNNDVTIQNCSGTNPNSVDPGCSIAVNSNPQTAGAVTTSGATVTWASGSLFKTSWAAGTGILINGAPFVIATVASTTSLTVTTALPTYTTPAPYSVAITLADGNPHSVTITYAPPTSTGCGTGGTGPCPGSLDVSLDNTDLFPGGVAFDLNSLALTGGNAYVGFTAATGGGDDTQDILSWTFTPQTQSAVVTSATQATLPFQNAGNAKVYDYTAQVSSGAQTVQIKPILMTQSACNAIVQKSFWPAHCFVYENAENSGMDAAVMFEVTCPQAPGGVCTGTSFQELGTDFQFLQSDNPLFVYPGILGLLNPFPGWLKGDGGPDPLHPCAAPATGALFQSNQINFFVIDGGTTKGKSKGGASCWVATYDTPGELLPGIKITSPTVTTYTFGQVVTAKYTCSDPLTSKPDTSLIGPYLTVASCTQSQLPRVSSNTNTCNLLPGPLTCTGPVDTSTAGLHTFAVTAIDSGGNTNVQAVVYNVAGKKK